mmetsp:Transcript_22753/g.31797  ORF Transcript_22753/g.31797 Transcript_22753/m.31797 type:complete len:354 (-) Transcript_22753:1048-2109(-)
MRAGLAIIFVLLAAKCSSAFVPPLRADAQIVTKLYLSTEDIDKGSTSQRAEAFSRRLLETRLAYEAKGRDLASSESNPLKSENGGETLEVGPQRKKQKIAKEDLNVMAVKEKNQRALFVAHLQMEDRQRAKTLEIKSQTEAGKGNQIGLISEDEAAATDSGVSGKKDQALSTLTDLGMVGEKPDPDFDPNIGPETMVDIPIESDVDEAGECDLDKPVPAVSCEVFKKTYVISKPEDLLNFVMEDERLSVVKVFARWCKTCAAFDLRYRKLNSKEGDKFDVAGNLVEPGRVRFAEMDYNLNEELCGLLGATKLPYIIIYKGTSGKVAEFQCGPSSFQRVIDNVNEFADPVVERT